MSNSIDRILEEIGELPYMPEVALRVRELLEDPEVSIKALRDVIVTDPALTARIMAVAYSPFYGRLLTSSSRGTFKRQDLVQAIVTLGTSTLRPLVMAFSVQALFDRFGPLEKQMWEHAIAVSITSMILVGKKALANTEDALLCGLLHDIGKTILANANRKKYQEVLDLIAETDMAFQEAELQVYGFDHAAVGAHAFNHWGFSKVYENAVRFHHDLDGLKGWDATSTTLAMVVNLANHICRFLGIALRGKDEEMVLGDSPSAGMLGYSGEKLQGLLEPITREINEQKAIFS